MTVSDFVKLTPAECLRFAAELLENVDNYNVTITNQILYKDGKYPQMNIIGLVLIHGLGLQVQHNAIYAVKDLDYRLLDRVTFLRNVWDFIETLDYTGMLHIYTIEIDGCNDLQECKSGIITALTRVRAKFSPVLYHVAPKLFIQNLRNYADILQSLTTNFKTL